MLDNSVISHKTLQRNLTDLSRHCQSSTGLVKAELKNRTSYLMKSRLYLGGGGKVDAALLVFLYFAGLQVGAVEALHFRLFTFLCVSFK